MGENDAVPLSSLAEKLPINELSHRDKLQSVTLPPVVNFFINANSAVGGAIFALALIEHFFPSTNGRIVTEKVLIALIVGLTLQVGAVIIAAFRGLFDPRASGEAKPKTRSITAPRSRPARK